MGGRSALLALSPTLGPGLPPSDSPTPHPHPTPPPTSPTSPSLQGNYKEVKLNYMRRVSVVFFCLLPLPITVQLDCLH